MSLYEIIAARRQDSLKLITAVSGLHLGQQLLYSADELLYPAQPEAGLLAAIRALPEEEGTALHEVGTERFFCETLKQEEELTICGAGHIAIPLIKLAKMIGFMVNVIDDREEFVASARTAGADRTFCGSYAEILAAIPGHENHYFVIVTRGHMHDATCLRLILLKDAFYVGMIGSRNKVRQTKDKLLAEGCDPVRLAALHAPIGLKIGAQTPEEIAVSIIAEMIQEKYSIKAGTGFSDTILRGLLDEPYRSARKALLTIVAKSGSAPRAAGAKMLVYEDGSIRGTIGGGLGEYQLTQTALRCIAEQKSLLTSVTMSADQAAESGMICGGEVEVFVQVIEE